MTLPEKINAAAEIAATKYPNRINKREDKTMAEVEASIKDVKSFFGIGSSKEFAKEWKELTDTDKIEIKELVGAELTAD